MPKLKSLRGSVGSYGRVAAGGIVEVDENTAKKLLETKRFVSATAEDIKVAQKAAAVNKTAVGATPGFGHLPEPPKRLDRLQEMIDRGVLTPSEARKLVDLQIALSPDEVKAAIESQIVEATAEYDRRERELEDRAAELDAREAKLVEAERATKAALEPSDSDGTAARAAEEAKAKKEAEAKNTAEAKSKASKGADQK